MDEFTEPVKFDENGKPTLYRWNYGSWFESLSTVRKRNHNRRIKVWGMAYGLYRVIPWMRWPVLNYIYSFWHSIFEEGIVSTCTPRWGLVTFGWLNDGFKPTLWHTLYGLTHRQNAPYTGTYPDGAPNSLKQAKEWEAKWERERNIKVFSNDNA